VTNETATEAELDAALPDIDWSIPPEGSVLGYFEAPSGRLARVSMGEVGAPRVILVPGVTGSKEDFALMLPIIAAAGYHVLSYDMAGQYESADAGPAHLDPTARRYGHELFVGDLIAVLESGEGPAHVLGYSFAGTVAQIALSLRPELFASLALLSCPPQPGQGFRGVKRIGKISHLTTGRVGAALMIWGLRRNVTHVPPGRLAFVKHRLGVTRRSSVADIIMLMKRAPDLRQTLHDWAGPKLVAVGEHDLWPTRLHAAFAEQIGATLAVYPTGHSPCETTPHQLSRDLLALYARA
jgi:pimeloyl-ACP methyl ester carboxylesterase